MENDYYFHFQVIVPLPVSPALCKALYDFRMSAPDEEGCLAFDKGIYSFCLLKLNVTPIDLLELLKS